MEQFKKKILVADDSTTIQKVVKITLSSRPYEIIEAMDENNFFKILNGNDIDLVLIDYSFSGKKEIFDFIAEIRSNQSDILIMLMIGTFDNYDEVKMESANIDELIMKPFESEKFISLCDRVLSCSNETEETLINLNKGSVDKLINDDTPEDEWKINAPVIEDSSSRVDLDEVVPKSESDSIDSNDPLSKEIDDWGITVPKIIALDVDSVSDEIKDDDKCGEIPSVIERDDNLESEINEETSEETNVGISENSNEDEEPTIDLEGEDKGSVYVSFDSHLKSQIREGGTDPIFNIEDTDKMVLDDDNRYSELEKEVEKDMEVRSDELWSVEEETVDLSGNFKKPDFKKDEDEDEDENEENEEICIKEDIVDHRSTSDIVEQVTAAMKPMLEQIVKDYFKENVERIAWDVIPDLAENLIKKEIENISSSIQGPRDS